MKLKYIVAAITAIGGFAAHPATATVFHQTVDLANQALVAGDVIETTQATGLMATSGTEASLPLGEGRMTVSLKPGASEDFVTGVRLSNGKTHDLGLGSSITIQGGATNGVVRAIDLANGSVVVADQLTIKTSGLAADTSGIYLNGNSKLSLGSGKAHIQLSNEQSGSLNGVTARGNSSVDLGKGSLIEAKGENSQNTGLVANGTDVNIKADELSIQTNGIAIKVDGGSANIDLGSHSMLTTHSGHGILLRNARQSSNTLKADHLSIDTTSMDAHGIMLNTGTYAVDLGQGSRITTQGNGANGVTMMGYTPSSLSADELSIETQGVNAIGLEVRHGTAALTNSRITSAKGGAVVAQGDNGDPASVDIKHSTLTAGGSYVAQARFANAVVNLDHSIMSIDRQGKAGYGLWGMDQGTINMSHSELRAAEGTIGLLALGGSNINLKQQNTIEAKGYAMMVDGADSRINAEGLLTVTGDVGAQDQGTVAINADTGSYFKGGFLQAEQGVLNFDGKNTVWDMTKSSNLNQLGLDQGTVNFADGQRDQPFMTLDVADLKGSGMFNMRSSLVEGEGDRLQVSQSSAGSHTVSVLNQGSAQTDGSETLTLITTPDGTAQFDLNHKVELGGYVYDLKKEANQHNWALMASSPGTDPEPEPNPNPNPGPNPKPSASTSANAAANSMAVSYLANFIEHQSLTKRLGELRSGMGQNDVWGRVYGGKLDGFGSGLLSGFDMSYQGIQFGLDRQLTLDQGSKLYLGAAVGLLDSDQDYQLRQHDQAGKPGSSTLKSYSAALYGTYLSEQHFYTDVVAKFARMKNEFDVLDSASNKVKGSANGNVWSLSAEVGKRFGKATSKGLLHVTPQAQLTIAYLNGTRFNNSNGLSVSVDDRRSVLARVGGEVGYDFHNVAHPTTVYAKAAYLKEFSGNAHYALNASQESHSFKGHWWQFGLGVNTQIKQQHNVYFDLESNQGNRFDQRQLNLGYRYTF